MYHPPHTTDQPIEFARLSLAKFSHTTTSRSHRGPLHWRHIIGDGDIIGIFEKLMASNHILFKVLHRNYMIEQIDLTQLVQVAASESQVDSPGTAKSIFAVVVKLPCLAIKYPTGNTYISRFQIKFGQDRDYYTALSILSDIKCPFSESNIGSMPLARKSSATQWQMGSSSSVMPSTTGDIPATDQYVPHGVLDQSHGPTTCAPAATSSVTAAQTSQPSSSSGIHNVPVDFWTSGTNQGSMQDVSLSQGLIQRHITPRPTNPNAPIRRPSTATTCYDAKSLENILPPKRQLPFLKPASQRVPTVPEPSPMRLPMPLAEGPDPRQAANNRPATSTGHTFRKPEQTNTSRAIPIQGTSTLPPEGLSSQHKPTNIPITPATEPSSIPPSLQPNQDLQPANPTQNTTIENMSSLQEGPESQTLDLNLANLSSYLSNPTAERTKALENWICQHIEDEEFIQLCQDVESVWRRIAVGK